MRSSIVSRRAVIRRGIGAVVLLSPLPLLVVSLVSGIRDPRDSSAGIGAMGIAFAVGLYNLWLSYGRPWVHRKRAVDGQHPRHVSGLPAIGTLLVVIAAVVGFGAAGTAALGLTVLAIDTGGSPWFLAATWNDESFWDPASEPRSDRET
jgi:hypothetical protein